MYFHNKKKSLIIKLALGAAIFLVAGCSSSAEKTVEPILSEATASISSPVPLRPTVDVPTSTPLHLPPTATAASTDFRYPLPMFSTTWSLPGLFIYSIAFDSNNVVWFATTNGVLRLENGTWTRFTEADGWPDKVRSIKVATNDILWVITDDGRVSNFNGEIWKQIGETGIQQNPPGYIMSPNKLGLAIASNGDLWAIGLGGVFRFDGKNWEQYSKIGDGLPSIETCKLLDIEAGPDGIVWISAIHKKDQIVLHFDGTQWAINVLPEMPQANNFSSMALPRDGSIWVGGNGGEAPWGSLVHYDGTTWKTYSIADGLADDYINDIIAGPDGIWFTTPEGVYRYDGETFETISNIDGYDSIAISPTGEVWLSGLGKVSRIPCMKSCNP